MSPRSTLWIYTWNDVVIYCIPHLIFIVVCSVFVGDELKKRFRDSVSFKSRSLKSLSLVSIVSGFITTLCSLLFWINGLCYLVGRMALFIRSVQPICVGLYSLNRLFFLFSQNRASNGYPKALFIGMTVIAMSHISSSIIVEMAYGIPKECGWRRRKGGDFQFEYRFWYFIDDQVLSIWYGVNSGVYLIWDLSILLLFVFKMQSLTHSVHRSFEMMVIRVRREMIRIIILTVLYLTACTVDVALNIGYWYFASVFQFVWDHFGIYGDTFIWGLMQYLRPIVMSFAVYLMQRHNSLEYGRFLKCVTRCRLHHCCCCYRGAVLEQREYFKAGGGTSYLELRLLDDTQETTTYTAWNEFSMDNPPQK